MLVETELQTPASTLSRPQVFKRGVGRREVGHAYEEGEVCEDRLSLLLAFQMGKRINFSFFFTSRGKGVSAERGGLISGFLPGCSFSHWACLPTASRKEGAIWEMMSWGLKAEKKEIGPASLNHCFLRVQKFTEDGFHPWVQARIRVREGR